MAEPASIERAGGGRGPPFVTVFGGTGFLGRRIVAHLLARGCRVRVAARRPEKATTEAIERVVADITDEGAVAAALRGADAAINAVSLYVEKRGLSFEAVHVEAAARLARLAGAAGLRRLVHLSGIGSDPDSTSDYVRARGRGERAVREAFAGAVLVRPSVMFGPDDAFLTTIVRLARRLPVYPLFGRGETRLQPGLAAAEQRVHVEDVGAAVARLAAGEAAGCYETAGPEVRTYRAIVESAAQALGKRPRTLPLPFPLWRLAAGASEIIPVAPLSRGQVALMQIDNVASGRLPGLAELGIAPRPMAPVIAEIASAFSRTRQR